jgi:hypothetical protein
MEDQFKKDTEWETSNMQIFWGEIAPCEHLVQIYDNDKVFLDTLEGFAGSGFLANETVVIIATTQHLDALNNRLFSQGFDLNAMISSNQYMPIDAVDLLSAFLVENWIDESIFHNFISSLIERAKQRKNKIRAFGEMVAILWERGLYGATIQLEKLWNELHSKEEFTLFCAYPNNGFTQSAGASIDEICKQHAKVIDGRSGPSTEIYYKSA